MAYCRILDNKSESLVMEMKKVDDRLQFSADIRLELLVNGRLIPLAKIGPDYAVLRTPQEIQAGESAVLIMVVDGREHQWDIVLQHGAVPFEEKFNYRVKGESKQRSLFNPLLH
jgi:hypothetical protein